MITRKRKVNINAKEVQISVCFTQADIRRWMEDYANILCRRVCDQTREEAIGEAMNWRESEDSLRYFFEHRPSIFLNYEAPYRQQLSAWAFQQSVSSGYIVQSTARPNEYLLTDKFFALVK